MICYYYIVKNYLARFNINITNKLKWEKEYENPLEMVDIIGTFIDNSDKYKINMYLFLLFI